jgi:ABC-type uncharacterized transport system involved in gliding motility auxiliary subunit
MRNDSIIITRQQIGQWVSVIGGVGLLLSILGFIWQGGLTPFIIGSLVVGIIGIVAWALLSPSEFSDFISGRQVRYSTIAVFSTLLLVGIVALTYILLQRAVVTLDMTEGRRFTLSSETLNVLQNVNRDIQITIFYSSRGLLQREVDDQFFRQYEVESEGKIKRVYIDPDEQPAMAQGFGAFSEGDTFISFLNDDGSVDFETVARVPRDPTGGQQEREMTQAILRLLLTGTFTVYFETSHDQLNPLDTSPQGLSGINQGMQESGLITQPLNLRELAQNNATIPADASAVIMARPTSDLAAEEIQVIDEYLQRGGSLFIMADAVFNETPFLAENGLFNQYLWENYGIRALEAVVVDTAAHTQESELEIIGATVFTGTDLGRRLDPANVPIVFKVARALEINAENPPTNNGRVVGSSEASFGETNLRALAETNTYEFNADQDLPGPLTTVAWSWDLDTDARILLVGDSDFVTNGLVASSLGNGILFTDGVTWLTGLGEEIRFSPQAFVTALPVFLDSSTLDAISLLTVFVLPAAVLAIGLVIWTRRVRR